MSFSPYPTKSKKWFIINHLCVIFDLLNIVIVVYAWLKVYSNIKELFTFSLTQANLHIAKLAGFLNVSFQAMFVLKHRVELSSKTGFRILPTEFLDCKFLISFSICLVFPMQIIINVVHLFL